MMVIDVHHIDVPTFRQIHQAQGGVGIGTGTSFVRLHFAGHFYRTTVPKECPVWCATTIEHYSSSSFLALLCLIPRWACASAGH